MYCKMSCKLVALMVLMGFVLPLTAGCERRREANATPIFEDDSAYVCTILLDLSGSFSNLMAEKGKGYQFALQVVDRYFRDRIGTRDKLVIAQISGTDRALLWQGSPTELRRDFPSAAQFRDFLMSKANPSGSFVNESFAQTLEYISDDPAVSSGQAKSAVFVLSDMLENGPNQQESEQKVVQALTTFGSKGGIVGIYYVDQKLVSLWRQRVKDAGVRHSCVEAEIVGRPNLPSFE